MNKGTDMDLWLPYPQPHWMTRPKSDFPWGCHILSSWLSASDRPGFKSFLFIFLYYIVLIKVRGLRGTNRQSQNSHGDVKHSIGNGVAKELIGMTHGHEQWWGDCLKEWSVLDRGEQIGKNWLNCNSIINKYNLKKERGLLVFSFLENTLFHIVSS